MEKTKRKVSSRPARLASNRRPSRNRNTSLKNHLSKLYKEHHAEANLSLDPVGYLDRNLEPLDLELLSFLLQGLSYGRVEQIKVSFINLMKSFYRLGISDNGSGIYEWLQNNDPKDLAKPLKNWSHRLNKPKDIVNVLKALKQNVYKDHSSIKSFFIQGDSLPDLDYENAIVKFCLAFESKKTPTKTWTGTGASWFAPSPQKGGTSKRLMMWLRWMIREDAIDLGLWKKIEPSKKVFSSKLLIPVDTHIFRFAQEWDLVQHNSPTWKSVCSITTALRLVEPEDPIKFDFSICHEGKLRSRKQNQQL